MNRMQARRMRQQVRERLVSSGRGPLEAIRIAREIDDHELSLLAATVYEEENANEVQSLRLNLGSGAAGAFLEKLLDKFLASPAADRLFDKLIDKILGLI